MDPGSPANQRNEKRADMPRTAATADNTCVLLTVEQAAHRLGIGRTMAFALIAQGRLTTVRIGRLRRIPVDAIPEFVESLSEGEPRDLE